MSENKNDLMKEQQNGEQKETSQNNEASMHRKIKWKKPIIALIVTAIVISLLSAVVIVKIVTNSSPEHIAQKYVFALWEGDLETLCKYQAYDMKLELMEEFDAENENEFFENVSDDFNKKITSWSSFYKAYQKEETEFLHEDYGDYTISCKVTSCKDISIKKLISEVGEYWIEKCETDYNFDRNTISKAKLVFVNAEIDGDEDYGQNECYVYLVNIKGSWRVIDEEDQSILQVF